MKPDGKSLDIVVVGLGQAGGNLAAEFFRRGYRALALNTAQTDLNALDEGGVFPAMPAERRLYIGLDGYDGAGADPGYGRDCVHAHADRIRAAVGKQGADADAVILTAGLGGGTGSSVAALIEVLAEDDLPLLALMTLPTEGESGLAKVNAVRAINELVDAPLMGWIFVDNGRISSLNQDISVMDYYAHINGQIAHPLDAFNRLNARDDVRPIRSFDGEDFRKLLLSGGVLNYAVAKMPGVSTSEVIGTVKSCLESSAIMPGGFDITRISYLGLVIEAPESALAEVPISTFEEIAVSLKEESEGAAIYYGIYCTPEGTKPTLRLIASTPSLPHRIREVLGDAKREGKILGDKVQEELPTLELGDLKDVELFRTRTRPSERPRKNRGGVSAGLNMGVGLGGRRPADLVDDIAKEIGGRRPRLEVEDDEALPVPEPAQARVVGRGRGRRPAGQGLSVAPPPAAPTPAPRAVEAPASEPQDGDIPTRPHNEVHAQKRKGPPNKKPKSKNSLRRGPPPELGTEEIDVVAQLAELKDLGDLSLGELQETISASDIGNQQPRVRGGGSFQGTAELPSPDDYDRLVSKYLNSRTGDERKDIAERLEDDSLSKDTVVRYYAVEAMAKLGRKSFGNALLHATEDADDAVRMLAVEALKG